MPASKSVSKNIRTLTKANKGRKKKRSRKQIIAIALKEAGKSKS